MPPKEKDAPPAPIVRAYAETLKHKRLQAGLSQTRLAEKAGVSLRYVAALEAGSYQPTITVMLAVAQAVGLTLAEMMDDVEEAMKADFAPGDRA